MKKWIVAAGLALGLSLLPGASVASADESCASGHACVWVERFYQGAKGESLCTGGVHTLAGLKNSGKDRCANKAVWFRYNGTAFECLNPGGNAPSFVFPINELWVGAEGSRC